METVEWYDLEEETRERVRTEFRAFVESAPLYQKHKLEYLPDTFSRIKPEVLRLYCPICKTEQPFRRASRVTFKIQPEALHPSTIGGSSSDPAYKELASRVYSVAKQCTGCEESAYEFICWVEVNTEKGWARKVGQVPPWTKQLDKTFKKALGSDAELYQRALDCISRSYGLGACAYLRRLVEHQIDPILRLILKVNEAAGADGSQLDEIRATIKGKNFDEKASLAYRVAPSTLIVEGTNPIKIIYSHFSAGVHTLDEEPALRVATEIATALEYVVVELHRQQSAREKFAEKIKSTFGFGG